MKTKVLLSAFLLCCVLISYGQWSYTNLSQAKVRMGSTSLGTKAYFAGGDNNINFFTLVEIYDVVDGTWTYGNLSLAREFPIGVSCGSKVFFAGGVNLGTNTVYNIVDIYDTLTQQWTVEYLSAPRFSISAVAKGNKVLFAGGINLATNQASAIVDIYDTETGLWTTASLSKARGSMGAAVAGDQAFFAGGYDMINYTNRVDIYNFSTGIWSTNTLSQARGFLSAASVGDKVLFAGGMTDPATGTSASNRVDIYNTLTGNWTTASLSSPRAFFDYATKVNNTIYFAGGGAFIGNQGGWSTCSNVIDIYNDANGTWSVDHLSHDLINHSVTSAGNSILVAGGFSCSLNSIFSKVEIYHDPTLINIPADYPTIQAGINAATPGDTVLVADGLYYENINFMGKKPLFVSSYFVLDGDTNHINNTIINGSQPADADTGSVVTFISGEDTTSVLCGFTITGGTGTFIGEAGDARMGGGVFIVESGGKLLNNHIEYNIVSNEGWATGGGINATGPNVPHTWVILDGNRISHNKTISSNNEGSGGGIECWFNLIMIGNELSYNEANGAYRGDGGGGRISGNFGPIMVDIRNNFITHNKAVSLSGITDIVISGGLDVFYNISGNVSNNVITYNEVEVPNNKWSYGAGAMVEEITVDDFVFENNLIIGNKSISGYCMGGGLSIFDGNGKFQNNVIKNNQGSHGGGISIGYNTSHQAVLINNTITGNSGNMGGGLYASSANAVVINNIIWDNIAPTGASIYTAGSSLTVIYSDVEGNSIWPGEGNVNVNPEFLDDGYHLSPQSLLKDVAVSKINLNGTIYNCPDFDIDNNTRAGLNNPPDIGADEVDLYLSDGESKQVKDFVLIISPNPFTNSVVICYTLEKSGPVLLRIFNNYGQLIAEPLNEYQQKGEQRIEWNGGKLPAGIYFFRLQTGNNLITEKIVKMH